MQSMIDKLEWTLNRLWFDWTHVAWKGLHMVGEEMNEPEMTVMKQTNKQR